jgi:hypothetical protein
LDRFHAFPGPGSRLGVFKPVLAEGGIGAALIALDGERSRAGRRFTVPERAILLVRNVRFDGGPVSRGFLEFFPEVGYPLK